MEGTQIDVFSEMDFDEDSFLVRDSHPPISPATGAESLFLAGLETSSISAAALAAQIHRNHHPDSNCNISSFSATTDDFASACACLDEDPLHPDSIFDKDALLHSREPHLADTHDDESSELDEFEFQDTIMGKTKTANSTYASAVKSPPQSDKLILETQAPETATEKPHYDPVSHVYEGAKGVWSWGKGIAVFSPFLGLAEGVASKAVGVVGTNLEEIDTNIKPKLHDVDDGLLNPAIAALVGVIMAAAGKSEEIVKPIVMTLLKPLGLIKNEAENAPELTQTASTSA